ncbi:hypothetical protein C1H46_017774 [Malus baccata]|uniref:Uncharacterized protein n=1 Tax=Malus baccata TaxID=106549 RepID=A0A540MCY9_MALBA|nr:hypothetical protein C1H46_017774 [Malus baccata]
MKTTTEEAAFVLFYETSQNQHPLCKFLRKSQQLQEKEGKIHVYAASLKSNRTRVFEIQL